ncbi:MAG: HlyD family type I secretion periplasmic adaptor subunit [Pseudolabrys sp.]
MTWSHARGYAPEYPDAENDVDASVGPQGAALICELRRLQKFLDQERHQERHQERDRFPRAIDVQPADRHFNYLRGARTTKPPKAPKPPKAVGRFLGMLGLNRRKPIDRGNTPSLHGETPAFAKRSVRQDVQDAKVLLHRWPDQRAERVIPFAPAANMESGYARHAGAHRSPERPSRAELPGLNRIPLPAETRSRVSSVFDAGREFLQSGRASEYVRSAYAFLVSHTHAARLDASSEAKLTTRLTHTFEDELKIGLRVLLVGVGILGGWAILVPLSGAVIVPGTLVVESDVKKIQHPAGGVVANIPVRDGMHVHAGDQLLRLDETQLRANSQVLTQQLDQIRARSARLVAERDGMDQPQMPHELANRSGDDAVRQLWASEISLFNSRAAARRSAKDLLRSRVGQLEEQISGLDAQVKSKAAQHDLISGELEGVDSLFQKGLVPLTRKTSLQREAARLDGERGQTASAIAEAKSKISEAELQAVRIDQDFRTEVMKDLREAQDKEAELVEKTIAAHDLLKRVDLRAPTSGIVHQLSVHTIGGVIAPGEVVMEIIPESDELQIEAKLPPQDIDHVHPGQRTYVRFSAFNQRTTPQLDGVVSYVSADLNHDRQSNANAPFYTVRVTLPPSERRRLGNLQLVSGMPVEVFLQTGSRTMMSYLLKPITDQVLRTFN